MIGLASVAKFFFDTKLGRYIALAGLGCAMFFGWLWRHDVKVAEVAKQEVYVESKEAGKKANAKNDEVRRRAAAPGAFDRLLKHSCRDCP